MRKRVYLALIVIAILVLALGGYVARGAAAGLRTVAAS
jgi:hypothetical protein